MGVRLGKRNKVRETRQQESSSWVLENRGRRKDREKEEVYPPWSEDTTSGLELVCVLNISKVWATRGRRRYNKNCGNPVQTVQWPQCQTYSQCTGTSAARGQWHWDRNNKSIWRQTPPPHRHENQASTKTQAGKKQAKSNWEPPMGAEASSIQGVGADWRSGPELCQALMVRWASSDRQQEDGFFMEPPWKSHKTAGHREHAKNDAI